MEWLTQNWIYLLLLVGVILFMRFGGMRCGFSGRHAHPAQGPKRHGAEGTPIESSPPTDPVSQRRVDPKTAVASMYEGRAYYFESRENRDRFEAAPQTYVGPASGEPGDQGHRHHRGGCC